MRRLSVCIPAYNRPDALSETLASLSEQPKHEFEVIISDDASPCGHEIQRVVDKFAEKHPWLPVRLRRSDSTVGYDANLRRLIEMAEGEYCVFLGDDDLLAPMVLARVLEVLNRYNVGVIFRAWRSVDKTTGARIEEHRYFSDDREFLPGLETAATIFRRSVFVSGLTIRTEDARAIATSRFDGTLLYQLYLVALMSLSMKAFYLAEVVAIRRIGGEHFFGTGEAEKNRFSPGKLLPEHSLNFVRGYLDIARDLDVHFCAGLFELVRRDLSRYSYPLLEIQARYLGAAELARYARNLAGMGLDKSYLFWAYYYALQWFGPSACNWLIRRAKRILGRTPPLERIRVGRLRS